MTDTQQLPANVADVEEAMRDVVDPELGINVVDLGLVYGITVDAQNHAVLDMTLTSAACPLTDVIEDQTPRRSRAWCPPTASTGCGCRRGARTRSPTTVASSSGPSASTSEPQPVTRRLEVGPERIARWLDGFAERHDGAHLTEEGAVVRANGGDGACAVCESFPHDPLALVLVRRGGYAVGLARGDELTEHKCGTRYVQSRTAAGGWSQQRFARRRGNQADELVRSVAEHALRILPRGEAAGLVVGGDRTLVRDVLATPGWPTSRSCRAESSTTSPTPGWPCSGRRCGAAAPCGSTSTSPNGRQPVSRRSPPRRCRRS